MSSNRLDGRKIQPQIKVSAIGLERSSGRSDGWESIEVNGQVLCGPRGTEGRWVPNQRVDFCYGDSVFPS